MTRNRPDSENLNTLLLYQITTMKQFFKFLFASCLGTFLALLLIFGVFIASIVGSISNTESTPTVGKNGVLHLKFDGSIPELTDNVEIDAFDFKPQTTLGLRDLTRALEYAKTDDDIKGIFLETRLLSTGFTTTMALRQAIADFKDSGKFVLSQADFYTQSAYYLGSVADEIYVEPLGGIDFRGFSAQIPFFKTLLDRVGVKMQAFHAGKYKSAIEPYIRTSMSESSREQTRIYLDDLYRIMLTDLSESRGIPVEELRRLADEFVGLDPEAAVAAHLIDGTAYREAMLENLRTRLGLEEDDEINFVKPADYFKSRLGNEAVVGDRVAILIAEGGIVDGSGAAGSIGDDRYVKLIDEITELDNIKAVVLRVNSPGGSAMASDRIWKALLRLKASGKPLIVSMGDYAASGGYYIACIGDTIFAEPSTLTGSIGVFSIIPQMQELFNDKLGIVFDTVNTGALSSSFTPFFEWSDTEKRILQSNTDRMYATFLQRVADGRHLTVEQVDSIAQGRVWTGEDAIDIGLVDQIGGLEEALALAGKLGNLSDGYSTEVFPKPTTAWERLLKEWLDRDDLLARQAIKARLGSQYPMYEYLREMSECKGVQMRMVVMPKFD